MNVGVYNPGASPILVGFDVHDESGALRNSVFSWVAAGAWTQIDDLYAQAGAGPAGPGSYVTFWAETRVFPFLIAIDNRSGDPTFLEPRESFQP